MDGTGPEGDGGVARTRRALLDALFAGAAGLAGCLQRDGSASGSTGPGVTTPAPGECRAVRPEPTATATEPREYPERPRETTNASVAAFVEAFERAYAFNANLASASEPVDEISVSVGVDAVERIDGGYLVEVSGQLTVSERPQEDETPPTPTASHEHALIRQQYYLTERFLVRDGQPVACWE